MSYRMLSLTLLLAAIVMLALSLSGGGVDVAANALILISLSIFLRWLDSKKLILAPASFPAEVKGEPARFGAWHFVAVFAALLVALFGCTSYL